MSLAVATIAIVGCGSAPSTEENVDSKSDALIAPGMLQSGYTPVADGAATETLATFGFAQIGEDFVLLHEEGTLTAYISTTNFSFSGPPSGELTRVVVNNGATTSVPVPDSLGGFMSGIDMANDGSLIFAVAFLDQSGLFAYGSTVYKYIGGAFYQISGGEGIGINGLVVRNGNWFGANTLDPNGTILYGSTNGGPASVWLTHSLLEPAASYFPQVPCDAPPMGNNSIRKSGRLLPALDGFAISNVTQQTIVEVPITSSGAPGTPQVMYDLTAQPDGLYQGTCGLTKKDTFIALPATDAIVWENPYLSEQVTVMPDCDAPTAVQVHDGYLYALCAASPLSCGTTPATFKRRALKTGYAAMCNWNN